MSALIAWIVSDILFIVGGFAFGVGRTKRNYYIANPKPICWCGHIRMSHEKDEETGLWGKCAVVPSGVSNGMRCACNEFTQKPYGY